MEPDPLPSLSCPICFELFNDPRVIDCGHSFCVGCLTSSPSSSSVTCPICRFETPMSPTQLPINYTLKNVIDDFQVMQSSSGGASSSSAAKAHSCSFCETQATSFCEKCDTFLCKVDLEEHQQHRFTKTHVCLTIAEYHKKTIQQQQQQQRQALQCQKHKREAELYCDDCRYFICNLCFALDHKLHEHIISIADVAERYRARVRAVARPLHQASLKVDVMVEEAHRHIEEQRQRIQQLQQLIKGLEADNEATAKHIDELKQQKDELRLQAETIERVSRGPTDVEILQEGKVERLVALLQAKIPALPSHLAPAPTNRVTAIVKKADGSYRLKLKFGSLGTGDGHFSFPRAVALNGENNIVVVDYNNHRIQVFNAEGAFLFKFGVSGSGDGQFSYPYSVAVDNRAQQGSGGGGGGGRRGGRIIVADNGNHRVQVFDERGQFLFKFGSKGTDDGQFTYPRGISVTPEGHIVVADQNNYRIQVFDEVGHFVRKWGSHGTGDGQFLCPRGVAVDNEGNVVVSDSDNHCIQIFDAKGTFVRRFGTQGPAEGQFNCPWGVAVDAEGNIVVVDTSNHRVQLFNSRGTLLLRFGSCGVEDNQLTSPCGVALYPDGCIVITDQSQRVKVYG